MARVDADNKSERDDETTSESSESDREQVDALVDANVDEGEEKLVVRVGEDVAQGLSPTQLGATRYVMSGFFAVGIALAYVFGRSVSSVWTKLASTQSVVDKVGWITYVGEDARDTWGMVVGGLAAIAAFIYVRRREDTRAWVDEAAAELAKVTWPNKKEVTTGTVVVVVASIIATVYFMLLDRFWGFVTDLVYRA
ncbi:MAG TPA: preprotein translocase subunit SecE [Polyangiaceae bacterium]|jgi:preprotein translocase subunit SecE|nr:MAG: preprotein translocase subunit SecE [Deltaproteobacteria bacterium ADurb.Bin207]HNS96522.1 preprotein translocase subunit SecE [Polyangiaceae bacterium]HNZ21551.1 preprotein translocase subunit SecE [Polyangiaceae bacterium]HOD21691.1 preprotein translocase subunit SecE [Polyangiaceae bacterium]HOE48150.1 preprotein translocase subunit SecE [Polyangiaceae bacterium]